MKPARDTRDFLTGVTVGALLGLGFIQLFRSFRSVIGGEAD